MSAADFKQASGSPYSFLFIPILLLFGLFVVAVLRSPSLFSNSGMGSAIIVAAPLILATYALTFVVMAGRGGVDLSIGPLIGFINVTLVQLFAGGYLESPFGFFVYAFAVGVAYQLLVGLIIVYVRIQPIIVALSGFLTLSGLNLMILPRPGGLAPQWMSSWGLGESIWSPVLAILVVATGAWFIFSRTAFYDHLRLMGSDERTAYASGVNITIVRLGAHVIAGLYAGLAALTFTSLISSGDPTQGSTYTLMTVTALVLGGTSLAGGRGSIVGSLLGALNIYLITYVLATFNFGKIQSFVTQLSYGLILVAALLLTIFLPQIQRATRSLSPVAVFVFLALVSTGVVLYAKDSVRVAQFAAQQAPVGQSLAGQSLSGQSLSGQSLSGQSLSGQSLSGQSLSGQSLAGTSLSQSGGAAAEPTGTPVVIAAVIIVGVAFLIFLLYRYPSLFSLSLVAVVALLLIGYAAHESGLADAGAGLVSSNYDPATNPGFHFLVGDYTRDLAAQVSMPTSIWLSVAITVAGALLLGTVLVFTAVPQANGQVSEVALWFMVIGGTLAMLFVAYQNDFLGIGNGELFSGRTLPILIGFILFVFALPTFQKRIRNITTIMITLLSITMLGAAFFSLVPEELGQQFVTAKGSEAPAGELALPIIDAVATKELSALFYLEVFIVLATGIIVFLLTISGVRRHVLQNVKFDPKYECFSYTGIFVAVTSSLGLAAVFVVGGVPIWKFFVALIACVIGARFLLHFLQDYRRKYGSTANSIGLDRQAGT